MKCVPWLPCKGSCQRQLTEGFSQRGFLTASHWYPLVSQADIPASSQAAYPSFPPKGEKLAHSAAPPFPTEPATLGFGGDPVREVASARTAEGLMQRSRLSCAKSACSMSKNPAAHNRRPHAKTNRWGTIPQSAKLTAPFTQRGLGAVRCRKCGGRLQTHCKEGRGLPHQ